MNEAVQSEEMILFEGETATAGSGTVVAEKTLAISVNGKQLVQAQCMPCECEALSVGFLVAEGILRDRRELVGVSVDHKTMEADVTVDIPEERLDQLEGKMKITSGCGRGVTIDNIEEVMDCGKPFNLAKMMSGEEVMRLGYEFNHHPGLYRETRCVHSAMLSDGKEFIYFAEDIGRHNAVDKVIGRAFLDDLNICELVLFCTGRFSFEMVAKAARVRIPIIISPAAATREAILLARRFHMALCGRVRKGSMRVYSCYWRITEGAQEKADDG